MLITVDQALSMLLPELSRQLQRYQTRNKHIVNKLIHLSIVVFNNGAYVSLSLPNENHYAAFMLMYDSPMQSHSRKLLFSMYSEN